MIPYSYFKKAPLNDLTAILFLTEPHTYYSFNCVVDLHGYPKINSINQPITVLADKLLQLNVDLFVTENSPRLIGNFLCLVSS